MTDIAFVTFADAPQIGPDDRLAADVLRSAGLSVSPAVWDDPHVDWTQFRCVVVRSAWDYHLRPSRFEEWLRRCASRGVNLWNPPAAILSNLNKRYLADFAKRGMPVVATVLLADSVQLRQALEEQQWSEAVIKPAVSAGGQGAWRTSLATAEADQGQLEQQMKGQQLLLQPFVPEVVLEGEWSLVFFAGQYSHAVIKRPGSHEFRVQQHLGGSTTAVDADSHLIEQAGAFLSAPASPLLYARVDGVVRDGQFLLMELEITEPYLFLGYAQGAAARFAAAIRTKVKARRDQDDEEV